MRKHIILFGILVLILATGAWFWLSQPDEARLPVAAVTGQQPEITPGRRETIPTVSVAKVVGWKQAERPRAAEGLQVASFAEGLDHPRWLYRLPNGDVLVAETNSPPREVGGIKGWIMKLLMQRAGAGGNSADRITLLRDADGDGVAEKRSAFLTGLRSPFGMALVGDWLYVANTDALVRFPYKAGETRITAAAERVVPLPGGGNHWARNVIADPASGNLFVSVGSASNIAENGLDEERDRAVILQVDPATKSRRIYAAGLRNPVGMAIEPGSKRLWAVVNERDMLGSDLPPDYLTEVSFGDFFGWPWSYWGGYVDKRVEPDRPDLLEYTKRPSFALGPHVAALGLTFADELKLGARWDAGAFVGEHGSWNRVPPSGYKVVFVPFGANGYPRNGAKPVDVLTGFLDAEGNARGRPVGLAADRTGALLVADDVGNRIWRVAPANASKATQ